MTPKEFDDYYLVPTLMISVFVISVLLYHLLDELILIAIIAFVLLWIAMIVYFSYHYHFKKQDKSDD